VLKIAVKYFFATNCQRFLEFCLVILINYFSCFTFYKLFPLIRKTLVGLFLENLSEVLACGQLENVQVTSILLPNSETLFQAKFKTREKIWGPRVTLGVINEKRANFLTISKFWTRGIGHEVYFIPICNFMEFFFFFCFFFFKSTNYDILAETHVFNSVGLNF